MKVKVKGKTKDTFLVVIVLFLTPLVFLVTTFVKNVLTSMQTTTTTTTKISTGISMEKFVETEMIDNSRCGGNASTVNLPEGWCLLNNESMPFYVGHEPEQSSQNRSSFIVRHYNHKGYERCLANKTLVFIGDSRVRFQFLYLASYLQSKRHMKCKDAFPSIEQEDDECKMLMGGDHLPGDRTAWYNWTIAEQSKGNEQDGLCDCYRKRKDTIENWFIKRSTSYGEINMVYLLNYVDEINMNSAFPPFSSFFPSSEGSHRCKPGECSPENRNVVFKGNLNDTMWNILPLLNTTHAFVNHGWAGIKGHGPSKMPQFSCQINEFTKHYPNIKMGFISHVPARGYTRNISIPPIAETMDCKNDVFDRYPIAENVPVSWYYDRLHVGSTLNREYNHQLVESLCPLPNMD